MKTFIEKLLFTLGVSLVLFQAPVDAQSVYTLESLPDLKQIDSEPLNKDLAAQQQALAADYLGIRELEMIVEELHRRGEKLSPDEEELFKAKLSSHISGVTRTFYSGAERLLDRAATLEEALWGVDGSLTMAIPYTNVDLKNTVRRSELKADSVAAEQALEVALEQCGKDVKSMDRACKNQVKQAQNNLALVSRQVKRFLAHQDSVAKLSELTGELRESVDDKSIVGSLQVAFNEMESQLSHAFSKFSTSSVYANVAETLTALTALRSTIEKNQTLMASLSEMPLFINTGINTLNQSKGEILLDNPDVLIEDAKNLRDQL